MQYADLSPLVVSLHNPKVNCTERLRKKKLMQWDWTHKSEYVFKDQFLIFQFNANISSFKRFTFFFQPVISVNKTNKKNYYYRLLLCPCLITDLVYEIFNLCLHCWKLRITAAYSFLQLDIY